MAFGDDIDIARINLDVAQRIARERGMAERARLAREIGRAVIRALSRLFAAPEIRERPCKAC